MIIAQNHIAVLEKLEAEDRPLSFEHFGYTIGAETLKTLAKNGLIRATFLITEKGKKELAHRKKKNRAGLANLSLDWMKKNNGKLSV